MGDAMDVRDIRTYVRDQLLDFVPRLHRIEHAACHSKLGANAAPEQRPWFLVVSGGRDGVGTTTVALNFAIVASQSGRRVLLVDADPNRGDAAELCRLEERYTLADVLAAR